MMTLKTEHRFPIEYKGFLYRKNTKALILNSNDFNKAIEIMKSDDINHLEINSSFFKGKELDFLTSFSFIKELSIISSLINNISPIQSLTNLKVLNIDHKLPGELDFRLFKDLKKCFFTWGISGSKTIFETTSLVNLRIDNYKKHKLFELGDLNNLKTLSLYYSDINNLNGIDCFENLEKIDLTGCKNIEDLKGIEKLTLLKELRVDDCKNLQNLDLIIHLPNLRSLSFNNVKEITSIKHFNSLEKLEEIFFTENTNIEDGDLSGLHYLCANGKLKKVIFKSRKHYSHKPKDLGFKVPDIVANIFRKQ